MKDRLFVLVGLTLLTAFTAYAGGRWAVLFLIPPVIFPFFLTLLASLWVLLPCRGGGSFGVRWLVRITALAGCWLFLSFPSFYLEDGYFEMGRRDHVRALFTPEMIAEVRASAAKLSARRDNYGSVELKRKDLPPALYGTGWGMPGNASCHFDKEGRLKTVRLIWGAALVAHHGLIISDEEIPFHGDGYHFTNEQGHDTVHYTERYYPLYPGCYIFLDEN